jgi:CheY-like chemotaxis protein
MSARFAPARLVTEVLADGRPVGVPPVRYAGLDALPAEAEADAEALRRTVAAAVDGLWRAGVGGTLSMRVALEDPDAHIWQFVVALETDHPDLSHLHTAFSVALPPPAAPPPMRSVLVVDDSPQHRALVTALLAGAPYQVTQAESGEEAVTLTGSRAFDIILMDVQMPGMDGPTAIRAIRDGETRTGRAPARIVALTRLSVSNDAGEAIEAGGDECLTKPPTRSALLKAFTAPRAPEVQPEVIEAMTEPVTVAAAEPARTGTEAPATPESPVTSEPSEVFTAPDWFADMDAVDSPEEPAAESVPTIQPTGDEPTVDAVVTDDVVEDEVEVGTDAAPVDLTGAQLVALTSYQVTHVLESPAETQQERLRLLGQGLRDAATRTGLQDVGALASSLEAAAESDLKSAVVAARTLRAWLAKVAAG